MQAGMFETCGVRFWAPLPPVPLLNLGTPIVESVEHYALRLAAITGIAMRPLVSLPPPHDEPGRHQVRLTSSFCGPGKIYRRRIENLEWLTGVRTIHCGSFFVLDALLAPGAIGRKGGRRRWCPRCYLSWDELTSCECLQWSIDLRMTCPIHGCNLEDRCPHCGSMQPTSTPYDRRRNCASCGAFLGSTGTLTPRSNYVKWVEAQISDMVAICADPAQPPISGDTFEIFVKELTRSLPDECRREPNVSSSINRLARLNNPSTSSKVALHTLINACALQGIPVRELILRPREAACAPLRGGWGGYRALQHSTNSDLDKARIMQLCLAGLLSNRDIRRLPRLTLIAQEIDEGIIKRPSRGSVLYREYVQRYRQQGSPKKLVRANADFVAALDCMKVLRPNPFGSYDVKAARYAVARATGRSLSEARELVGSVTRFRRIVELAKAKVLDLTPAEVRAQKKLGGIYDHWPDLLPP